MLKKVFCIVIFLYAISTAIGQDSIKLLLEFSMVHIVDTTQPKNPRISPCMLMAGSKTSVYDDYYRSLRYLGHSGIAVNRVYDNPSDIQDATAGITCDQIYTDFDKQILFTGRYFSNTLYTKEEPIATIEWSIQPQKKEILQQECQMATATFKGRNYTAWFAPAIPISSGPWKLHGLPGIILAANDDKNEISFTCTKISLPEKNTPAIAVSKNAIRVSPEKFDKTKKAFEKDPKAGKAISDPRGTLVALTVSPSGVAAMQTKNKPRVLNNPIEKE